MTRRRARRLAALVFAAAAGLACGDVLAAKLPDWAQSVAAGAPALSEEVAKTPRRVLLRERFVTVKPDGTLRVRVRAAEQVLTTREDAQTSIAYFPFDDRDTLKVSRAWHLPPGERVEKGSALDQVDLTVGDAFLTDQKARIVAIPDVRRGSLVFFEFEAESRPYVLALVESFWGAAPIDRASFAVEIPDGWTIRSAWPRGGGVEPVRSGPVTKWEVRDLPELDDAPLARPYDERRPLLQVAVDPPAGTTVAAETPATWAAVSAWYDRLSSGRDDANGPNKAIAAQVVAGAGDGAGGGAGDGAGGGAGDGAGGGALEKARRVATFVRDKVRYSARTLGIGGFQPHFASETLGSLHGDCKDKVTAVRALLGLAGITSYALLVNATTDGTVSPELATPGAFNHAIVAVALPAAEAAGAAALPARLDGGDLGTLLVVDPTSEYTSFGWIPAALSGRRALLVAGDRGRLVTLPVMDAAAHRVERRSRGTLGADGQFAFELTTRCYGESATDERAEHRASRDERRKGVEARLREDWLGATPTRYEVTEEEPDGAFVEIVGFSGPVLRNPGSPPHGRLFALTAGDVWRVALGKRTLPVRFPNPIRMVYESKLEGLPAEAVPPRPREAKGDGWSCSLAIEHAAGALTARWEVTLTKTEVEPAAFPDLKKLYSAAAGAAAASVEVP